MKVLFIEARRKEELKSHEELSRTINKAISGKIHLLYSVQYKTLAEKIRKALGKRVLGFQQVLGCSKIKPKASLLLIGSGRFHALQLALSTGREVYIYNSYSSKISKISREEIEQEKMREQGKQIKLLSSDSVGILFSNKPGQSRIKEAARIKEKLQRKFPGKAFYLLLADNINLNELENFPVDMWINASCPGLQLDSGKIINYIKK